jgi:hypothetical protein
MSSNEEAKTITLSAASNIQRTNEVFTSYESLDEGSTYFEVLCRSCQQALGRYYVTTSKDLDHVREKFTFSIDAITSYELGKAQHGKIPEVTVVSFPVAEEVAAEDSNPIETVQEDVTKVNFMAFVAQHTTQLTPASLSNADPARTGRPGAADG